MEPKLYRTLIRIIARQDTPGYIDNGAWCVCSGWKSNAAILVPAEAFGDMWRYALPNTRLFGQASIGVDSIEDFAIAGPFEFASEPDLSDGL